MTKKEFLMNLYKIARAFSNIEVKTEYIEKRDSGSCNVIALSGKKYVVWPINSDDEKIWLSFKEKNKVFIGYTGGYKYNSSRQIIFNVNNPKKNFYREFVTDGLYGRSHKRTYDERDLTNMADCDVNWLDMKKAVETNGGNSWYIESSVFELEWASTAEKYADKIISEEAKIIEETPKQIGIRTSLVDQNKKEFKWVE